MALLGIILLVLCLLFLLVVVLRAYQPKQTEQPKGDTTNAKQPD
jgi:hypothetical protein